MTPAARHTRRIARQVLPSRWWEWAKGHRTRRMLREYTPRWVRRPYGSVELDVLLADPMGELWYDCDFPEPPEFQLAMKSRLQPTATVFDCGCHHGVIAAMLASAVPGGQVIAVDAIEHNVTVARTIAERNKLDNITVVHAAVTETSGHVRFSEQFNGAVHSSGSLLVDSISIDDLSLRFGPPSVILIDIEGSELDALRGATKTLEGHPDLLIEVHVGCGLEAAGGSVDAVVDLLDGHGYQLWVHDDLAHKVPQRFGEVDLSDHRFFLTAIRE